MKTNFYRFNQNNTGGEFDVDDKLCGALYIEAMNAIQANAIAVELGVYFYGCDAGIDCPCCGDRWDKASEYDAVDLKKLSDSYYNKEFTTIEDYVQYITNKYERYTTPKARIFYLSGEVKEINC